MSYVDDLAQAIRRVIPPRLLPDGDTTGLFRLYAVLAMTKGDRVVLEDVHDAWSAWMREQDPQHPSLRPLRELPAELEVAEDFRSARGSQVAPGRWRLLAARRESADAVDPMRVGRDQAAPANATLTG